MPSAHLTPRADMANFKLFVAAEIITFGFIAALQFIPFPWFFIALLCMHGGVFLFIFSKKRFTKAGQDVKKFYTLEYKLLALYLPVLLAKVLSSIGLFTFDATLKSVLIIAITVFCAIVSTINSIKLYTNIKRTGD